MPARRRIMGKNDYFFQKPHIFAQPWRQWDIASPLDISPTIADMSLIMGMIARSLLDGDTRVNRIVTVRQSSTIIIARRALKLCGPFFSSASSTRRTSRGGTCGATTTKVVPALTSWLSPSWLMDRCQGCHPTKAVPNAPVLYRMAKTLATLCVGLPV